MSIKNYLTPTKRYKILASAVHSVYRVINSTFELKELINRLSRLCCQIINTSECKIIVLDATKKFSVLKCTASDHKKCIVEKKEKIEIVLEKNILKNLATVRRENLLAMPMISEDIVGMVILKRNKGAPAFESYDQELLTTIIEQAIIGIKNLQLYDEQQKIVLGSVKSLVTLLDTRVPQEYTHSPYFSRLVTSIAVQMHLDEKQVESIKYASLLHDAGKADIPLDILKKKTKLTKREFDIIKRHPEKGAEILRSFQILRPVIPIIMYHHEKYNGTGYPSKLKKGQIPLGARIMSVADAFEAMVYGRPYRERMDIHGALREIKKKSGTQFDPKVVDAFLKVIKRIKTKNYLSR
jgi:putative nucleotidyltransferase with HDIG domain